MILERDEPGFAEFTGGARFAGTIAQGIRYAADHGAGVVDLSLAGNEAVERGAGRGGHPRYSYPASFPGVISVAAVDAEGRHVAFSNRNPGVVVSAPGVRIIGAGPARPVQVVRRSGGRVLTYVLACALALAGLAGLAGAAVFLRGAPRDPGESADVVRT